MFLARIRLGESFCYRATRSRSGELHEALFRDCLIVPPTSLRQALTKSSHSTRFFFDFYIRSSTRSSYLSMIATCVDHCSWCYSLLCLRFDSVAGPGTFQRRTSVCVSGYAIRAPAKSAFLPPSFRIHIEGRLAESSPRSASSIPFPRAMLIS